MNFKRPFKKYRYGYKKFKGRNYRRISSVARKTINNMAETKFTIRGALLPLTNDNLTNITYGLDNVPLGTGPSDRVGSKIQLSSLSIRALFELTVGANVTAAQSFGYVTMWIIYPRKSHSGAQPVIGEILGGVGQMGYFSPDRWITIKRKTLSLSSNVPNVSAGSSKAQIYYDYTFKWRQVCNFQGNVLAREPYVVFLSSIAPLNSQITCTYATKATYKDV